MNIYQILYLIPLSAFYIAYLAKMLMLKRQGIRGNILGKGSKPKKVMLVERLIQTITYTGAAVQYASIIFPSFGWPIGRSLPLRIAGFVCAVLAVAVFVAAVIQMQNNWRAGFSDDQNTSLVTSGIYKASRNPAFTGFDLLYIGCALAFPSVLTILWAIAAVLVFNFQIIGEEKYLATVFGDEYTAYKRKVCRYIGRKP